ncbi:MAG: EamA/RhaT family transporter [Elusimicrobia bacterium CG_4_9_14_3_um_filter_62_55]|nr:MAG: EamA/RhaT family transporter [Elusimicrobia bacterium CG_4_10_14_0_2_um_filter_63_34]PJB25863.1 MAG: EamA/RhaT family transporter [Elusimicrobia bacterium CG_4_9_14_3_um_filter_62_55]
MQGRRGGVLSPRLGVLTAALLFSTGGAAIKACGYPAWTIAGWRSGIAALTLLVLLPRTRTRPGPGVLTTAAAYAATLLLFVLANKNTTSANAIFLQSAAPLYVLLLSPRLLGERGGVREWIQFAFTAAGLTLFLFGLPPVQATAPRPALGNAFAIAAGIGWALTLMGLRKTARADPDGFGAARAALWGNAFAFLAALPFGGLPLGGGFIDGAVLLYLGVFQIGVAYTALTAAFREVPAGEASLLLMLEPALNPLWAWLAHGERVGPLAAAGGALILGAGIWRAWPRPEEPALNPSP